MSIAHIILLASSLKQGKAFLLATICSEIFTNKYDVLQYDSQWNKMAEDWFKLSAGYLDILYIFIFSPTKQLLYFLGSSVTHVILINFPFKYPVGKLEIIPESLKK